MEIRQEKDFKSIFNSVKGNCFITDLVYSSEEKLVTYKMLENFAKLSPITRQVLVPSFKSVARNLMLISDRKLEYARRTI